MRCEEYELRLSALLDGELGAGDVQTLEVHLKQCESCATELATLRGSVRLLRALPPDEPPRDLRVRILTAIRDVRPSPWQRLAAYLRVPAPALARGMAASAVAATIAGWVLFSQPAPKAPRAPERSLASAPLLPEVKGAPRRTADAVKRPVANAVTRVAKSVRDFLPKSPAASPDARSPRASSLLHARSPSSSMETVTGPAREERAHRLRRALARATPRARPRRTGRPLMASRPPAPRKSSAMSAPDPSRVAQAPELRSTEPAATGAAPPLLTGDDETLTMMASMPMMGGEMPEETLEVADDPLTSLRRRLAEERRTAPATPLQPHNARGGSPKPVRIEF